MILITNFGPYGAVKGLTNLQDTRGSMASMHLRANLLAIFMIFIMIFSSFSVFLLNNYELEEKSNNSKMTLIGDSEIVEVSTFPNGFSEDFSLIIPEENALDILEFDLADHCSLLDKLDLLLAFYRSFLKKRIFQRRNLKFYSLIFYR